MLGGSSSINYMLYVRGNKRDYDNWRDTHGCTGWGYDDVLPYFLKSEDNQNPFLAGTKYHNKGGYLTVGESSFKSPIGAAFIQGGVEMGYENRDYNGEFQTGKITNQIGLNTNNIVTPHHPYCDKFRFHVSSGNDPPWKSLFRIKSLSASSPQSSESSHFNEFTRH